MTAAGGPERGPTPVATYRLQLTAEHDLDAVAGECADLADLGVSHLYLSPVFEATPGSSHGYDVTDPTRVRAELGGPEAFARLVDAARAAGLGLVVDIVPNHQATAVTNPWWWSLLAEGLEGPAGTVFDVADEPVLVPVLGAPLDEELRAGALEVRRREDGTAVLGYHDRELPVRPDDPDPDDPVAAVVARQHHRPTWWREGGNYRRFFDIDDLVGVRVEDPAVFDRTHALIRAWCEQGVVDGLRVDHVDGLADPGAYLHRLAEACPGTWLLVEKILEGDEELPPTWPVAGTTGYEAATLLDQVSLDPAGEAAMTRTYQDLTGDRSTWAETVATAKAEALDRLFPAELDRLAELGRRATGGRLDGSGGGDGHDVRTALRALLLAQERYRAYVPLDGPAPPEEAAVLEAAADRAVTAGNGDGAPAGGRGPHRDGDPGHGDGAAPAAVDLLLPHLLGRTDDPAGRELATRFQQLSGPVMAKGVEDTASYRYLRLVAVNEVGGDPGTFGTSLESFHAWAERATALPHRLLAGTTHDTKRSESVRARLLALAQVPDPWRSAVERWSHRHPFPDPHTGYLAWQTLVGAWPLDGDRLGRYLEKAGREAKRHTSWTDPDQGHEAEVQAAVHGLAADRELLADVASFVATIAPAGRAIDLGHLLLRATLPGVPDLYQGSEDDLLSLVDPDNRRGVDPAVHRADTPRSRLLRATLALRRAEPDAFGPDGGYEPLDRGEDVVAFVRGGRVAVLAPRFPLRGRTDVDDVDLGSGWQEVLEGLPVRLLVRRR